MSLQLPLTLRCMRIKIEYKAKYENRTSDNVAWSQRHIYCSIADNFPSNLIEDDSILIHEKIMHENKDRWCQQGSAWIRSIPANYCPFSVTTSIVQNFLGKLHNMPFACGHFCDFNFAFCCCVSCYRQSFFLKTPFSLACLFYSTPE